LKHPALLSFALGAAFALQTGLQSANASEIEEVKVVADFRGATASDLATSLSVLTEEDFEKTGARHFDEIVADLPNVNFSGGTSRARFFQIRGIGERSQFAAPLNPSVGYIVDNVDFSGIGSTGTLFDAYQVGVFRGPQGTRYGANALAGLIYIKTNDPTDEQYIKVSLTGGNYGNRTAGFVYNQPFSDNVSARFAIESHQSDGFYRNDFLDTDDNNERDELSARAKLAVKDFSGWQVDTQLSIVDVDNGYDTFSLDNVRVTRSDQPGRDTQESISFSMEATRSLDFADLTIIAALSDSELEYSYDEDWTFTGFDPIGYTSFDQYLRDKDIGSFEARLISNDDSRIFDDSTDWIVGFYHLTQDEDLTRNYTFLGGPFSSAYDFDSTALFFQMDTEFGPDWGLAWGGRVERRSTDYDNSDLVSFSPSENLWGGRIALQRFYNDATMAYVSVARGYKAGGFNTDGTLPVALREFDSEYLIEYELGIKTRVFEDRVNFSAALFFDDRKDQQVSSSFVQPRPDGSTEFVDFLGNAAEGTNQGLELGAEWFVSDNFTIDINVAILEAEFDEFINAFGDDLSGRDQAQAPSNSYQVGFYYEAGNWQANLSVVGQDKYFFSDRHNLEADSRDLVNASIRYLGDNLTVTLWGRNLADDDYTIRGFGSFGNDPRNFYATEPYVQFGEPRVFGVTTEVRFAQ
jgi:outer membrane receptor protein involved in Fe transport